MTRARGALARALLCLTAAVGCAGAPPQAPTLPGPRDVAVLTIAAPPAAAPAAAVAESEPAAAAREPDPGTAVPVTRADPSWGDPLAPVTLVIWGDYQCPFTMKLMTRTVPELQRLYGPERLRLVWKHNPLPSHREAPAAHAAAEAVFRIGGPRAFWDFHGRTLEGQRDLSLEALSASAGAAGVGARALQAALDGGQPAAKVEADIALGKRVGVTGTPASLINGAFLGGAQPIEKFRALIDEQQREAEALRAGGTPPALVYARLSEKNKALHPIEAKPPPRPADTTTVWRVPVDGSPARGNPSALVTLVVFSGFQCPFCKKAVRTIEALEAKYGDALRVVHKSSPLPFHPRSEPAAELALEARAQKGDKGFWAAHEVLFDNQERLSDQDLEGHAAALGLDAGKVKRAIAGKKHAAAIERDLALADELEAGGTPHFFVNGRRVVGAQPVETFAPIIDAEIVRARALLALGVKPARLYAALQKDAKGPARLARIVVPAPTRDQPAKGAPPGARVTVQFFSGFQCPFCKKAEPRLDELIAAYPGKVRVVFRHKPLPMHKDGQLAAEAAVEAFRQKGDAGFWAFARLLWEGQSETGGLGREALERRAAQAGLDLGRLRTALDQRTHRAAVEADSQLADQVGISGTPVFVVNDYYVSGAQSLQALRRRVDKALGPYEPPTPETLHNRAPAPAPAPAPPTVAAQPGEYGAKHLLIMYAGSKRAPSTVTRTRDEALALAARVRAQIRRGATFESQVALHTDEPGGAARQGDLGTFQKGRMVPEFEAAVERLAIGEVSDPVETPFGFHLILRTR